MNRVFRRLPSLSDLSDEMKVNSKCDVINELIVGASQISNGFGTKKYFRSHQGYRLQLGHEITHSTYIINKIYKKVGLARDKVITQVRARSRVESKIARK